MRGSRKFCKRGSNFFFNIDTVFSVCVLIDEGREGPNATKSRPSYAMDSPTLNAGSGPELLQTL